jgi:hypothetical protein
MSFFLQCTDEVLGRTQMHNKSLVQFPAAANIFLFSKAIRLALGYTQPPIHWVPGSISSEVKQLIIHFDLILIGEEVHFYSPIHLHSAHRHDLTLPL